MEDLGLGSAALTRTQSAPRLLQPLGLRHCRPDAAQPRLRADGAGVCRACSPSTAIPTGPACASAPRCSISAARCGRRSAASPALCSANSTGKGCVVDASLYETALGLLTVHFARFQASGTLPERHPSGSLAVVIFQAFDTADGQVIVAAANDRLFAKFAVELGHPRMGAGCALQDQRRSPCQQGCPARRWSARSCARQPSADVGGAAGKGRRAVRGHQRHDPHEGASADGGARHGAAGAGDRPRHDGPAAVARRPAPRRSAHARPSSASTTPRCLVYPRAKLKVLRGRLTPTSC